MKNPLYHKSDLSNYVFLVTGGAGFIGSNIVEYLIRNNAKKVIVLDNFSTGYFHNIQQYLASPSFQLIVGDIRDLKICETSCEGVDFIFHEAALGSVPRSINDPITTNEVNISGFLNILLAAKEKNVKRVIYAASSSTYGDSKKIPKVEDQIGNPLSPYAVTKLVNELYAKVFSDLYGISTIGLRYFNVFGPRQNPKGEYAAVIPLFIQAFIKNIPPSVNGNGLQTRDFTYIENVVQANIKAAFANTEALNAIYNVACGERHSLMDVISELKKLSCKEYLNPKFNPSRNGDVVDSLADISKAKLMLSYHPEINFKEGLQKTYDWFFKNNLNR
jgi:UDP-N-acetylglucosamine/UDP-N-acetylgalactosamine 4-epimerase